MGNHEYELIKSSKRLCKLNETMRSKTIAADQSVVSHDGPCCSANVSTVASNIEIDGPGKIWRNASLLVELDAKDWQAKQSRIVMDMGWHRPAMRDLQS